MGERSSDIKPMRIIGLQTQKDTEFVDIHCHFLPEMDDGAVSWGEAISMARMAVNDGFTRLILTPHQLGNYRLNTAERIRRQTEKFQSQLSAAGIPLEVRVGGDVRVEPDLLEQLDDGNVLSLADHSRHLLLELPHELYFPIEQLVSELEHRGYQAILSHPERNQGILAQPEIISNLISVGCLMQVTAGSFVGAFGSPSKRLAERMLAEGAIHFVATDAHGIRFRRPNISRAFETIAKLASLDVAQELCSINPSRVYSGQAVAIGNDQPRLETETRRWFSFRRRA